MISGIYRIINIINNKFYLGSAINLIARKNNHFNSLKYGNHHSKHLQNAYNKHVKDNFIFEIIEYCNKDQLITREQYYLDTLLYAQDYINKINIYFLKLGYNINPTANSPRGRTFIRTKEQNLKISLKLKNRIKTPEHILNYRLGKSKKIIQYDLKGNFIREWNGASFAAEELGLNQDHIIRVCRKDRKKYKNYVWKYK